MPLPLLVSNLTNIRYLSGVSLTAGMMLLQGKRRTLFVDDRYTEKARAHFAPRKGASRARGSKGTIRVRHIDELKNVLKRVKRVRFEAEDVTVARLKRWKKKFRGTRFVPSEGIVEEWRRQKRPEELRAIVQACRTTDRVLKVVPRTLKTGMSEKEIAWQIEKLSRELGADAMAFETIVAFGPHTSRPHHRPTSRKLRRGDIVQIDMGVKMDGYCSDCSRVFFTGKPTKEQRQVFSLLVHIMKECTKRAGAGILNSALDKHARELMRNQKRPAFAKATAGKKTRNQKTYDTLFLHSLGHGVGLEIHEGLNLTSRKGARRAKLLTNEVITIEPGIYFAHSTGSGQAGKWGMRIEDTVRVTREGGKTLTMINKVL